MTTLYKEKKTCAVCGAEYKYTGIGSTNTFGSPDLDTRPPEMKRSTIFTWVKRCPECGYCASDISKAPDHARSVVRSAKYKEQLADPAMPELANSFLCKSIIDESAGAYTSAAWALIHAAWVCDDGDKPEYAKMCRSKAADMIIKAMDIGQEFAKERGSEIAILVDIMRRAGRFTEARQLIEENRTEIKEDIILKVLTFQELLIDSGDEGCHTIAEAIEEKE